MQNRQFCSENIIKAPVLQYLVHIQQFFTGYCRVSVDMFARYKCFARKTHKLLQVCKQVATNAASCVRTSACSHVACCNKFTTTCNKLEGICISLGSKIPKCRDIRSICELWISDYRHLKLTPVFYSSRAEFCALMD
jgi:hypothetical protein